MRGRHGGAISWKALLLTFITCHQEPRLITCHQEPRQGPQKTPVTPSSPDTQVPTRNAPLKVLPWSTQKKHCCLSLSPWLPVVLQQDTCGHDGFTPTHRTQTRRPVFTSCPVEVISGSQHHLFLSPWTTDSMDCFFHQPAFPFF